MRKQPDLDQLDRQILSILMHNSKTPYTEIAKKLFVSGGTIHVRMKKLEDMGIVQGYHLEVDHSLLGYDISAFLGIYLDRSSLYDEVAEALAKIPEIVGAPLYDRPIQHPRQDHLPGYQSSPGSITR